jgi:predicted Zn-dependent protease
MTSGRIEALLKMLERGPDSAVLRFSLGTEYLGIGARDEAIRHLRRAVELDPKYSAAWKLLGRSLAEAGRDDDAILAYRDGIEVAEKQGDRQAAKEMNVFLKRLMKKQNG